VLLSRPRLCSHQPPVVPPNTMPSKPGKGKSKKASASSAAAAAEKVSVPERTCTGQCLTKAPSKDIKFEQFSLSYLGEDLIKVSPPGEHEGAGVVCAMLMKTRARNTSTRRLRSVVVVVVQSREGTRGGEERGFPWGAALIDCPMRARVRMFSLLFFQDTTLELNFGRRYGLIGRNGSGKSTFLKALASVGVHEASARSCTCVGCFLSLLIIIIIIMFAPHHSGTLRSHHTSTSTCSTRRPSPAR
jgi:ABC-type multidrug transport system fused ATPase/permease subunit